MLHSFGNGTDGLDVQAGLINAKGTFYGTTLGGGAYGYGTVYVLNARTGAEKVLYSFCSQTNCPDGNNPWAPVLYGVINVGGTLYGTTYGGGAYSFGTVFKINAP